MARCRHSLQLSLKTARGLTTRGWPRAAARPHAPPSEPFPVLVPAYPPRASRTSLRAQERAAEVTQAAPQRAPEKSLHLQPPCPPLWGHTHLPPWLPHLRNCNTTDTRYCASVCALYMDLCFIHEKGKDFYCFFGGVPPQSTFWRSLRGTRRLTFTQQGCWFATMSC